MGIDVARFAAIRAARARRDDSRPGGSLDEAAVQPMGVARFAVSRAAQTDDLQRGGSFDHAHVQHTGADVARFTAIGAARQRPGDMRTILVVARFVPVKGVDIAVEAMRYVRSRVRLVVAGDGPERSRLEALGAATGLDGPTGSGGAIWLGRVDATTRDALLAEAACVVIPSRVLPNGRSEGTPMIALEALAAGVPVVASAVGGLRDLPGVACVPPADPRALAAAIDRAVTAETRQALDLDRFDYRHVTARLLAHAVDPAKPAIRSAGRLRKLVRILPSPVGPLRRRPAANSLQSADVCQGPVRQASRPWRHISR
jgi:glycosyltransferase involved in cell wall biosynthesis